MHFGRFSGFVKLYESCSKAAGLSNGIINSIEDLTITSSTGNYPDLDFTLIELPNGKQIKLVKSDYSVFEPSEFSNDNFIFSEVEPTQAPTLTLDSSHNFGITDNVAVSSLSQNLDEIPVIESPDGQTVYPDAISSHRMTMAETGEAVVTFKNSVAGYNNSLGWYKIAEDGTILEPQLFFSGAKSVAGGTEFSLGTLAAGTQIGFFVIANGAGANIAGELKFVDENGNPASIYQDGEAILMSDNGEVNRHVFHSNSNAALNADGQVHGGAGWDVASSDLLVGLEDLYGGGDKDYNDILFYLDLGQASENLKYFNAPSLGGVSISDADSTQLLSAQIVIENGFKAGDKLVFEGGLEGTGLTADVVINGGILTLNITGDADLATYESVINSIRLLNDSGAADISGTREISINLTDDTGEMSSINTNVTVTLNPTAGTDSNDTITGTNGSDALYGRDGDDVISGGDSADLINGGLGVDFLTGGDGNDVFDFSNLTDSTSTSRDTITDFTQGEDVINLVDLFDEGIIDFSDLTVTNDGSNTLVSANDNDFEVELIGVHNLKEDDFDWG